MLVLILYSLFSVLCSLFSAKRQPYRENASFLILAVYRYSSFLRSHEFFNYR